MTTITNNELTDDVLEYVLAVVEDRYENRKSNAGEDDRIILALRELQKRRKASKEPVRYLNKFSGTCVTLEQQPNAADDVAVYIPLYAAPPAPVVPEEMPMPNALSMYAVDAVTAIAEVRGWNACRAAMLQGGEQPQNARQNIPDGNSPVSPDGWISCSERMPDNDESKPIAIFTGKCLGQGMFVATYDDDGFFDYWEGMEIIGVSHWMPLPEPPQKELLSDQE